MAATRQDASRRRGRRKGGVISPLLANIYLHDFDRAFQRPRRPCAVCQRATGAVRRRLCATTARRGDRDVSTRRPQCSLAAQGMRDGPSEPAGRAGSKPP